jgi:hypothetical protein
MPTIVATAGASNANSYVTLAEAETYMETRLHKTAWEDAESSEKEAALIWAARLIDRTMRFNGTKVASTQALAWPRSGLTDESGFAVAENSVPQIIKDLQVELAFLLLSSDRTAESSVGAQGITDIKAGPVSLSFKDEITIKTVPDTLLATIPVEWTWRKVPYPLVVS